jgi:phosphate acetyltransferase
MNKAIYIATSEHSGKSITLGLMSMLIGKTAKVGYFRPIIEDFEDGKLDNHIETVISHFGLILHLKMLYLKSKLIKKENKGKIGEVLDLIIDKYKRLEEQFDFVLVEGTSFSGEGPLSNSI